MYKKNKLIKISYQLLLIYLTIFPFISYLNLKLFGKVGIDNLFLLLVFLFSDPELIKNKIKFNKNNFEYILFLSLFLIATLLPTFNTIMYSSDVSPFTLTQSLRFLQPVIFLLILKFIISDWESFKKLNIALLIGTVFAGIVGLLQALDVEFIWNITERFYVRGGVPGTFMNRYKMPSFLGENANHFGAYMAVGLIVLLGYGKHLFRKDITKNMFIIVLGMGLIFSMSMTSIIAFMLFLFIYFWKEVVLRKKEVFYNLGMLVIAVILVMPFYKDRIIDRIETKFRKQETIETSEEETSEEETSEEEIKNPFLIRGLKGRYKCWRKTWFFIKGQPLHKKLLGTGYSKKFKMADNYYLELLRTGGFFSVILFISIFGSLIILSGTLFFIFIKKRERLSNIYFTFTCLLISFFVMSSTAGYIGYFGVIIPMALIAGSLGKFKEGIEY
ncbi:MAG: O-antigen ligase family protein [Atribacterota bacterium]